MTRTDTAVHSEAYVHTLLGNRWWVYQKERFPVAVYAPLIAAFSYAAVGYSMLARAGGGWPGWRPTVVAFATSFLFFLQLRLADEFKDFEDDARYRPYRPVPRGLVKLRELAFLWAACTLLQLLLAIWLSTHLLLLLGVTWAYLLIMSKEFFVPSWLKRHALLYMLTHMAITTLVFLYASACDWVTAGHARPPSGLVWMLAVSYFNGMVIEIGRKVRAPGDEEPGVETYSSLWGRRNSVLVWLAAVAASAVVAYLAAQDIHITRLVVSVLLPGIVACLTAGGIFLGNSRGCRGKWIETISGVWVLASYLSLGAIPVLQHWYGVSQ